MSTMWCFRGYLVVLLSFALHSNAQFNMDTYFETLGCEKIELSQEEQTCFINYMKNMMSAYGSLASSASETIDDPNPSPNATASEVASVKAMMEVFGKVCENDVCLNGMKKTFTACKSYFQKIISFDMVTAFEVLCYKNSNGKFCVNDLPLFQTLTPPSCNNASTDQKCSDACAAELRNVSSTCCYPSMLALFYSESSPKEDYTQIWKSCKMSTPKLCDLPTGSYPNNENDDHNKTSDKKTSDGVIFGYIAIILILSVIILLLMIMVVNRKCKSQVTYDDDYTKVPFDIQDSDA